MLVFLAAGKAFPHRVIRSGVFAMIKKGVSSDLNYFKAPSPSRGLKNVDSVSVQILMQLSLLRCANDFDSE